MDRELLLKFQLNTAMYPCHKPFEPTTHLCSNFLRTHVRAFIEDGMMDLPYGCSLYLGHIFSLDQTSVHFGLEDLQSKRHLVIFEDGHTLNTPQQFPVLPLLLCCRQCHLYL